MSTTRSKFDYQSIYNLSPTGIIILDANGIILESNKTFRDWLDVKTSDVTGKNIFMLKNLSRESKVKILEQFSQRNEGKPIPPYEIKFTKKKGEHCRGAVYESPITNKNGDLDKILVVISDITRLSSGESGHSETPSTNEIDKEYKSIFLNAAVAILSANHDELITHWNTHTEELLNKTKEDLYLKHVSSIYTPEEWKKIKSVKDRTKEKKVHFETKVLKKDGGVLDALVSASFLRDQDGKITRCIVIIRDISAQKRAENAAHVAQNRYQTIFENSAVGIMMADENENIVSWNSFSEKLLGKSRDDLFMKPVQTLYPEEEWDKMRAMGIRKKGMLQLETKMITHSGKIIDISISISVLKNDDGKILGSIGVFQDITKIKKAEELGDDFSRMKNEFVSMVSHELRTPIASIRGSIEIVTDESAGPINPEQKDFLQTAMTQLSRLENLISDVIDYQEISSNNFELSLIQNNLNDTIERVRIELQPFADAKGISLNILFADPPVELIYDDAKISQVVRNLIQNAIKFTDVGSVTVSMEEKKDFVEIIVMDTGRGIAKEDINKLFWAFSQISGGDNRETGATGLGLAISQLIIEKHGGTIHAESEIHQGAKFIFTLPFKH